MQKYINIITITVFKWQIMNDIEHNIKIFRRTPDIQSIDWNRVSVKLLLKESFIREHADKLSWYYISRHQNLSIPFIIEYSNYVEWYYIVKRYKLPKELIDKFYSSFDEKTKKLIGDHNG